MLSRRFFRETICLLVVAMGSMQHFYGILFYFLVCLFKIVLKKPIYIFVYYTYTYVPTYICAYTYSTQVDVYIFMF